MNRPLSLPSNQPADRFYLGGERIRAFRGEAAQGDRVPEDWVGSVTTLFGESKLGLTTLPDGRLLTDAVAQDPVAWLGERHVAAHGEDPLLLVKLLDAGERLPVHLHPHDAFAAEHLGAPHGKAEAWYVLHCGTVHLGFKRDVEPAELSEWVEGQRIESMLAAMHAIRVEPGDGVYVPPGMPHAIGADLFVAEVQEPADLSILLEWDGYAVDGPGTGHLGLGFDLALKATDRRGRDRDQIERLVARGATLPDAAAEYFRVELVDGASGELPPSFAVLIVLEGAGELVTASERTPIAKGETVLVPHGAGSTSLTGDARALRCLPPALP